MIHETTVSESKIGLLWEPWEKDETPSKKNSCEQKWKYSHLKPKEKSLPCLILDLCKKYNPACLLGPAPLLLTQGRLGPKNIFNFGKQFC